MVERSGYQKLTVLKMIFEGQKISEICRDLNLQPSVVYYWRRLLFLRGVVVFTEEGEDDRPLLRQQVTGCEDECRRLDEEICDLARRLILRKREAWGPLTGRRTPRAVRDQIVDEVTMWVEVTELPQAQFLTWLEIGSSKFQVWKSRYGIEARRSWPKRWDAETIIDFAGRHPLDDARRLTNMMLDQEVSAASHSTVYHTLHREGVRVRWTRGPTPGRAPEAAQPHMHWHVDIMLVNLRGQCYLLGTVMDDCSRAILHWELCETMPRADVGWLVEEAYRRFPDEAPCISDVGHDTVLRDFRNLLWILGVANLGGARELSAESIRALFGELVTAYNQKRLHGGIDFVTPWDRLQGRHEAILEARAQVSANAKRLRRRGADREPDSA